ncbi:MAG: hypothetical protein RIS85_2458 [Pseudomonadota bacterium]
MALERDAGRRSDRNFSMLAFVVALLASPPALARAAATDTSAPTAQIDAAAPVRATSANAALDRLFAEDAHAAMNLDPLGALEQGLPVPPEQFVRLFTPELAKQRREANARTLAALTRIDAAQLDANHRISRAVFENAKRGEQALWSTDVQALIGVQPFNHFGGFHVAYPEMSAPGSGIPLASVQDYQQLIARHRALPRVFDQAIDRFREGMASGVTEPRLTVDNMIVQIDALLAQPISQSPFTAPALQFPASVAYDQRPALRRDLVSVTKGSVYPAYRRLRAFLANEYRPVAREQAGLSAMKGGADLYRLLARLHTTLDLDPAAVHNLGLGEVARIKSEMDGVKGELGFAGPLRDFFDHIRTDPRFHPRTEQELAEGFRAMGRKVDALAPQYFLHLPRTPLQIQPYPAYRARFEAGGSYGQGSADGKQPGVFFYNTYDLKSRFLTGIATLYLHEGAPGHHFQISLAQENADLPDFQRFGGNTAYIEGWALYAETLGYEMGFYKDPMQHWGTLDDEMLRAMRLVVDTGIHTKGWSREQAVDYMLANSGMGRSDAQAEVDRYIANPGQALAYKIGALTIQRLRKEAERALGPRFDIRQFHDQVLGSGALPMPVLEAKVRGWIAATR